MRERAPRIELHKGECTRVLARYWPGERASPRGLWLPRARRRVDTGSGLSGIFYASLMDDSLEFHHPNRSMPSLPVCARAVPRPCVYTMGISYCGMGADDSLRRCAWIDSIFVNEFRLEIVKSERKELNLWSFYFFSAG